MKDLKEAAFALLRVGAGVFFLCHGGQKLFSWFGGMPGGMVIAPMSKFWFAGVIELVGGAAIALGLFTRPVAFLCSGEMAVAYFTTHLPKGVLPIQNGGEAAALYSLLFLYISARGAGGFSLDSRMKRSG